MHYPAHEPSYDDMESRHPEREYPMPEELIPSHVLVFLESATAEQRAAVRVALQRIATNERDMAIATLKAQGFDVKALLAAASARPDADVAAPRARRGRKPKVAAVIQEDQPDSSPDKADDDVGF